MATRDEFSVSTKELLAKRVGYVCSNPQCRRPTSGPQDNPDGSVNLGVAAHITAASPGGPRYDLALTSEQRVDSSNGIWLCQTCAKLVDNDPVKFDRETLESWKRSAEQAAAVALAAHEAGDPGDQFDFAKAEKLMPKLLAEMRADIQGSPTQREFILLQKNWHYNSGGKPTTVYYFEDHEDLEGKLDVLANLGLVTEITHNNVRRYLFSEELVDYLMP